MSEPIYCPKCKGSGELSKLWGVPADVMPFSEEYNSQMRHSVPDYEKYEVLRLEGCTSIVKCLLCEGSGIVFVTPAIVNGL